MIVKIQKPLMSTDPNVGYLVYNEDRSFLMEAIIVEEIILKAMGDDLKMYAEVTTHFHEGHPHCFKFIKRIADQPW